MRVFYLVFVPAARAGLAGRLFTLFRLLQALQFLQPVFQLLALANELADLVTDRVTAGLGETEFCFDVAS